MKELHDGTERRETRLHESQSIHDIISMWLQKIVKETTLKTAVSLFTLQTNDRLIFFFADIDPISREARSGRWCDSGFTVARQTRPENCLLQTR